MPTFIDIAGAQVVTSFTPDARTVIACPACTHLIPNVTSAQLNADPVTAVADWIDCACQHGEGGSVFAVHLDCPCYARFRVQYGAGNRYNVVGVDYATMEQRRQEREAAAQQAQAAQAELDAITARVQADEQQDHFARQWNAILAGTTTVLTPPLVLPSDDESLVALRDAEEPTTAEAEADVTGHATPQSVINAFAETPLTEEDAMELEQKLHAVVADAPAFLAAQSAMTDLAKPKAKRTAKKG